MACKGVYFPFEHPVLSQFAHSCSYILLSHPHPPVTPSPPPSPLLSPPLFLIFCSFSSLSHPDWLKIDTLLQNVEVTSSVQLQKASTHSFKLNHLRLH